MFKKNEEGRSFPSTEKKLPVKINVHDGHLYYINGVKVIFPVKAYPTQITMMNKILQGLDRKQNCLLESPTGSGKSLALLCSCLAWQTAEKARLDTIEIPNDVERYDIDADRSIHFRQGEQESKYPGGAICSKDTEKKEVKNLMNTFVKPVDQKTTDSKSMNSDDDEDFAPISKKLRRSIGNAIKETKVKKALPENERSAMEWKMEKWRTEEESHTCSNASTDKLPKIYFGTRTHKQITQIIRELRKTVYKDVRMTILGSREYLCINPMLSKVKDKNEECKKLVKGLEGGTCRFHSNVQLFCKPNIKEKYELNTAWDIEDLVKIGKKIKACPYFGTRELQQRGAEIIFCPYNYLTDPLIRTQMGINLKDQIVILDEGHNIEDSSRDAASVTMTALQLDETKSDLQELINAGVMVNEHTCLRMLCDGFLSWIETVKNQLIKRGFEDEAKVWNGKEMVKMLHEEENLRLTPTSFALYKTQLSSLMSDQEPNNGAYEELRLSSKSINCLSSIMLALEKLLNEEKDYASDYRVVLYRTSVMAYKNIQTAGGWMRKSKYSEKIWTYKLNFWCLNPAVVFSEIGEQARCIILSSGTLSPMNSFSSELGVRFPIQLEANHVIADSQVWVGNLTVGPSNQLINANFKNSETYLFQDDVGNVLLQICNVIPKGVLCFFPSYSMMEKLVNRWKGTGLWQKLSLIKIVLIEPRGGDKNEFDGVLNEFYDCVKVNQKPGTNELNGALLLAVCRGKISEGIDFSDDNARAVLTVGIPFPNVKDVQVELKKKYNNLHSGTRSLLTGNEWYEIQAFRALNQALGRCIRHRNDWGALLIIDERFSKSPKYINGLSKWVRNRVQIFTDFQTCLSSLSHFATERSDSSPSNRGNDLSTFTSDLQKNGNELVECTNTLKSVKTRQKTEVNRWLSSKKTRKSNDESLQHERSTHDDQPSFLIKPSLNECCVRKSEKPRFSFRKIQENECVMEQAEHSPEIKPVSPEIKLMSTCHPFVVDLQKKHFQELVETDTDVGYFTDQIHVESIGNHVTMETNTFGNDTEHPAGKGNIPDIADGNDDFMGMLSTQMLMTGTPKVEYCKKLSASNNSNVPQSADRKTSSSNGVHESLKKVGNVSTPNFHFKTTNNRNQFLYPGKSDGKSDSSRRDMCSSSNGQVLITNAKCSKRLRLNTPIKKHVDKPCSSAQYRSAHRSPVAYPPTLSQLSQSLNNFPDSPTLVLHSPPLISHATNNHPITEVITLNHNHPTNGKANRGSVEHFITTSSPIPVVDVSNNGSPLLIETKPVGEGILIEEIDKIAFEDTYFSKDNIACDKNEAGYHKKEAMNNTKEKNKLCETGPCKRLKRKRKNLRASARKIFNESFVSDNHSVCNENDGDDDDDDGESNKNEVDKLFCKQCNILLLLGKGSIKKERVCTEVNPFLKKDTIIYTITDINSSSTIVVKEKDNCNDSMFLNCYWNESNQTIYVPMYCGNCLQKSDGNEIMVGVKSIYLNSEKKPTMVLLADSMS